MSNELMDFVRFNEKQVSPLIPETEKFLNHIKSII
jgi:hypothetical protein